MTQDEITRIDALAEALPPWAAAWRVKVRAARGSAEEVETYLGKLEGEMMRKAPYDAKYRAAIAGDRLASQMWRAGSTPYAVAVARGREERSVLCRLSELPELTLSAGSESTERNHHG